MESLIGPIFFIGKGLALTLSLLLGSLLLGLLLAIGASVLRHYGIGVRILHRVISILRGTPLILQLSLIYFAVPGVTGIKLNVMTAGILAFGLNSFAYLAEILRSGVESIPKGQFEAAKTLHIPTFYLWKDIIFPQVLRNIFPALLGEIIALLKETALIATIGGMDLMRSAQTLAAQQFTYFLPLCIAAAYYYALVLLLETVGGKLTKRLKLC